MKKIFFNSIWVFGLLVLASCLGDPATNVTLSNAAGVVKIGGGKQEKVIHVKGGQIISSDDFQKAEVEDGECILLDYSIDYGAGENANGGAQNGYLTATIYTQRMTKVDKWKLSAALSDTVSVQTNEQTISSLQTRCAFIEGNLFLFTQIANHTENQVDSFSLSFNPNQVSGSERIYELYLRSIVKTQENAKGSAMIIPGAFDIQELVKKAGGTVSNPQEIKFRVHYVSGFAKDSTQCIWQTSDIFTINSAEK